MPDDFGSERSATATLDFQLQLNAGLHGDRIALADDPDRIHWNGTEPLTLDYAETERRVAVLAARFRADGLQPGMVLALSTPNMAEAVIAMFAAIRAGLVVAPVPALWRWRDAVTELSRLRARALVTTGVVEGEQTAQRWRGIATEVGTIDRLYGVGAAVPPDFDDISGLRAGPALAPSDNAARLVTITLGAVDETGAAQLHGRAHRHWQAAGDCLAAEAAIRDGDRILLPFGLSGFAALGAGLVPWLRSAGTLHLHHFRSLSALVGHAATVEPDLLLVPGSVAETTLEALSDSEAQQPRVTAAIWKDRHPVGSQGAPRGGWIDLTVLDDLGFVASARCGQAPAPLPLVAGEREPGYGLQFKIVGRPQRAGDTRRGLVGGKLAMRGSMVPPAGLLMLADGNEIESGLVELAGGFIRSATSARIVEGPAAVPDGRDEEFVSVNGVAVATAELDQLYASQEDVAEAACFVVPSGRLAAAVVMRPGTNPVSSASFTRALTFAGAALHQLPELVAVMAYIPRRSDGSIDREVLAKSAGAEMRRDQQPVRA